MKRIQMFFLLYAFLPLPLLAEGSGVVMPVEIQATSNDNVGQRLVYFLKEDIRQSPSMKLAPESKALRLQVKLVTLDPTSNKLGYATVYSVVFTVTGPAGGLPYYLNQFVGQCGTTRVQECAQDLLVQTSKASDAIVSLLKNYVESQSK